MQELQEVHDGEQDYHVTFPFGFDFKSFMTRHAWFTSVLSLIDRLKIVEATFDTLVLVDILNPIKLGFFLFYNFENLVSLFHAFSYTGFMIQVILPLTSINCLGSQHIQSNHASSLSCRGGMPNSLLHAPLS